MRLSQPNNTVLDFLLRLLMTNVHLVIRFVLLVVEGSHDLVLRLGKIMMVGSHFDFLLVLLVLNIWLNGFWLKGRF
jgi:hypothetical protein